MKSPPSGKGLNVGSSSAISTTPAIPPMLSSRHLQHSKSQVPGSTAPVIAVSFSRWPTTLRTSSGLLLTSIGQTQQVEWTNYYVQETLDMVHDLAVSRKAVLTLFLNPAM